MEVLKTTIVSIALILAVGTLAAQERGTIRGAVVDERTGEGLPGANVILKGTYYGAASDVEGQVLIERVNPGSYTLEITLLGYTPMQFTDFRVEPGGTARFRAPLKETVLTLDQDVVIIGEKPLFNIEETASRRTVGQEEIQAAAITSVQSVVALQPGVVYADNEIHIRGGRTHENAYLLDGISVQDQLAGTGFGLQLSPTAIKEVEVITGGYNAEYGQATSGIVSITTREGGDRYSGSVGYRSDQLFFGPNARTSFNTDAADLTLSGPEPITSYLLPALGVRLPGTLSLFATVYTSLTDGYTRWVEVVGQGNRPVGMEIQAPNSLYSSLLGTAARSPRRSNNYSWLGKLSYRPSPTMKLSYAYTQSEVIDQNTQAIQVTLERVEPNPGYQYLFQYIPDSANTFTQQNIQHLISWTHTLSEKVFYEFRLSRYSRAREGRRQRKELRPVHRAAGYCHLPDPLLQRDDRHHRCGAG